MDKNSVICMPVADNFTADDDVQARHPDWKLVSCPICGRDCYESGEARLMRKIGMSGACTFCDLKQGLHSREE